jgi:hypothetical protein
MDARALAPKAYAKLTDLITGGYKMDSRKAKAHIKEMARALGTAMNAILDDDRRRRGENVLVRVHRRDDVAHTDAPVPDYMAWRKSFRSREACEKSPKCMGRFQVAYRTHLLVKTEAVSALL